MATFYLSPIVFTNQWFTNTGVVLAGGLINTYLAGTSTPQATYQDSGGITPNANPIVLNSAGRIPGSGEIWVPAGTSLKLVITDSASNVITTLDNVSSLNDPGGVGSTGTFTGTITGVVGTVSGTVKYTVAGKIVGVSAGVILGTSNANTMTLTGFPSLIAPITQGLAIPCELEDNGVVIGGWALVSPTNTGIITFGTGINNNQSGFTASGTKGLGVNWYIGFAQL